MSGCLLQGWSRRIYDRCVSQLLSLKIVVTNFDKLLNANLFTIIDDESIVKSKVSPSSWSPNQSINLCVGPPCPVFHMQPWFWLILFFIVFGLGAVQLLVSRWRSGRIGKLNSLGVPIPVILQKKSNPIDPSHALSRSLSNPHYWKTVLVHPWIFPISRNAKKYYTKRKDDGTEKPVKPPKKAKTAPKAKAGAKWNVLGGVSCFRSVVWPGHAML